MNRSTPLGIGSLAITYLGASAAVLGFATAPAASQVRAPAATVIKVTAGKPTEFAFTLSKSTGIPVGNVLFKVTNKGSKPHLFKVCATPVKTARQNACSGKATSVIAPGKSASLTVDFGKSGSYEYLCTGSAVKGMKGLIVVGAPSPAAGSTTTTPAKTSTTPTGSSPPASTTPASSGDAAAGLIVFNTVGCANCHSIDDIKGLGGVNANFNSIHPLPFDTGPLTAKQIGDLAAYIASGK